MPERNAATCQLLLREDGAAQIPTAAMLDADASSLRRRAQSLARALRKRAPEAEIEVVPGVSRVGGGAAPEEDLPTHLVAIRAPGKKEEQLAKALRREDPPIVVRTADGRLLLDPRTLLPDEGKLVVESLARLLRFPNA